MKSHDFLIHVAQQQGFQPAQCEQASGDVKLDAALFLIQKKQLAPETAGWMVALSEQDLERVPAGPSATPSTNRHTLDSESSEENLADLVLLLGTPPREVINDWVWQLIELANAWVEQGVQAFTSMLKPSCFQVDSDNQLRLIGFVDPRADPKKIQTDCPELVAGPSELECKAAIHRFVTWLDSDYPLDWSDRRPVLPQEENSQTKLASIDSKTNTNTRPIDLKRESTVARTRRLSVWVRYGLPVAVLAFLLYGLIGFVKDRYNSKPSLLLDSASETPLDKVEISKTLASDTFDTVETKVPEAKNTVKPNIKESPEEPGLSSLVLDPLGEILDDTMLAQEVRPLQDAEPFDSVSERETGKSVAAQSTEPDRSSRNSDVPKHSAPTISLPARKSSDQRLQISSLSADSVSLELLGTGVQAKTVQKDAYWQIGEAKTLTAPIHVAARVSSDNGGTYFQWAPGVSSRLASRIQNGRLRLAASDGTTQTFFLRSTHEIDPLLFDLEGNDFNTEWRLGPAVNTRLAQLDVSFALPPQIETHWIKKIPHRLSSRHVIAIVEFATEKESFVALRVRYDILVGAKSSCRQRWAARLDPSLPWHRVTLPSVTEAADQLAKQRTALNDTLHWIKRHYSKSRSRQRTVLRDRRETTKAQIEELEENAARLAHLIDLMHQLQVHGSTHLRITIPWSDATQVILSTSANRLKPLNH